MKSLFNLRFDESVFAMYSVHCRFRKKLLKNCSTSQIRSWIRSQISKSDIISSRATCKAEKALQFGGNVNAQFVDVNVNVQFGGNVNVQFVNVNVNVLIRVVDLENELGQRQSSLWSVKRWQNCKKEPRHDA